MSHPYHKILCSMYNYILTHITDYTLSHIMSNLNLDDDDDTVFDGAYDLREKTERLIDVLLNVRPVTKFVDAILQYQQTIYQICFKHSKLTMTWNTLQLVMDVK